VCVCLWCVVCGVWCVVCGVWVCVCVCVCVCECVSVCVLTLALNTAFITKSFQFYYQITALMKLNKISFTTINMQKDELQKLSSLNTYNSYTLKLDVL